MASNYPGGVDAFDTIASDKKTSDAVGGRTHRAMHNDLGDAIEAVQTELGTDPAGGSATVKARFEVIEANDWVTAARIAANAVGSSEIADSAVTSAKIADGTIVDADVNASAAIARSKISGLPTSSTDNTVVRFDSTAGAMQTSGVVIDDNNRLTVVTGATGGYGFASGAVELSGTGTPEGVVTAAPGSTWLQTDSTTDVKGWIKWVKATGTGNTGWVAGPEADTGWRTITSLLVNSWTATVLKIRRVGDRVTLCAQTLGGGATLTTQILTLPSGFTGLNTPTQVLPWREDTGTGEIVFTVMSNTTLNAYGSVAATGITWTAGHSLGGQHSWPTSDAWPASLPGSAA